MGLAKRLKNKAVGLSQQAMERLLSDDRRAQQVAAALGTVQRGRQMIGSTQRAVMNQFNFATQADFKEVGKALSALTKRLRALEAKLGRVRSRS